MYYPKNYSWFVSRCSGDSLRTVPGNTPWNSPYRSSVAPDSCNSDRLKIRFLEHVQQSRTSEDCTIDYSKKLREVTDLLVTKPVGLEYYLELAGLK